LTLLSQPTLDLCQVCFRELHLRFDRFQSPPGALKSCVLVCEFSLDASLRQFRCLQRHDGRATAEVFEVAQPVLPTLIRSALRGLCALRCLADAFLGSW